MAFKSLLGSLVRGSTRCSSSPAPRIAVEEAMGPADTVQADRLRSLRNALLYSDGRKSPVAVAAAGTSAFAAGSSRCLHGRAVAQTPARRTRDGFSLPGIVLQRSLGSPAAGRGARRFHGSRDVVFKHADGAIAILSVVVFSVTAAILHRMEDTDEFSDEAGKDIPSKTNPYLRSHQLNDDLKREMASYNKTIPDEKTVVREYMEDDQAAMRARFEEWMEEYGRTYKEEVEKARRFKIFKAAARYTDAANAGHSTRFGLNKYSDWNAEEVARLYGIRPASRDGGYFKMVMSYLAPQGIWHHVDIGGSANNKEYED